MDNTVRTQPAGRRRSNKASSLHRSHSSSRKNGSPARLVRHQPRSVAYSPDVLLHLDVALSVLDSGARLRAIGEDLGVTRERVRQLFRSGLRLAREMAEEYTIPNTRYLKRLEPHLKMDDEERKALSLPALRGQKDALVPAIQAVRSWYKTTAKQVR